MAVMDITPMNGFGEAHQRTLEFKCDPSTDSQIFEQGHPVYQDASGRLVVSPNACGASEFAGIATAGPGPSQGNLNPRTGVSFSGTDGVSFTVVVPTPGMLWRTSNITTTVAETDIGETAGFSRTGSTEYTFSIDTALVGDQLICRIADARDNKGLSVTNPNVGTITEVVFEILSHQGTTESGAAVDPAS